MNGLTEGRIVHFVLPNGEHRPAIVVRVWPNEFGEGIHGVNLQVFTDGSNDDRNFHANGAPTVWQTSIRFDLEEKAPGTCHWIEPA